jgi:hypothetical protein
LEIDPDKRVREALHLAFCKFAEFGSVRQVAIWLCDEGLKMPIVCAARPRASGTTRLVIKTIQCSAPTPSPSPSIQIPISDGYRPFLFAGHPPLSELTSIQKMNPTPTRGSAVATESKMMSAILSSILAH